MTLTQRRNTFSNRFYRQLPDSVINSSTPSEASVSKQGGIISNVFKNPFGGSSSAPPPSSPALSEEEKAQRREMMTKAAAARSQAWDKKVGSAKSNRSATKGSSDNLPSQDSEEESSGNPNPETAKAIQKTKQLEQLVEKVRFILIM